MTSIYNEYCIGCGLCKSELQLDIEKTGKGFLEPEFKGEEVERRFLQNVCPINGTKSIDEKQTDIWGKRKSLYGAWASDESIRRQASSGGVLTALAIFMLERKLVDAVIHVVADEKNPTETKCQVSTTKEQIISGCGSRYSISSPWLTLSSCVEKDKKYAAIGKPCDIAALRNLKNFDARYENIIYLLSFFCAGLPSAQANDRLLNELGCDKEKCVSLTYRGNGWPGYATAIDSEGKNYQMEYSKAWGGILGRDVHPYCRLCIDGIGEAADISCGDGWYITTDGKEPDFSEREGRNVVFTRTEAGEELYQKAMAAGAIQSEEWEDIGQLRIIQKYQYTRRATMAAKLKAYKLFGRKVPKYNKQVLSKYAKGIAFKEKFRMFLGTGKRILQKKI